MTLSYASITSSRSKGSEWSLLVFHDLRLLIMLANSPPPSDPSLTCNDKLNVRDPSPQVIPMQRNKSVEKYLE